MQCNDLNPGSDPRREVVFLKQKVEQFVTRRNGSDKLGEAAKI